MRKALLATLTLGTMLFAADARAQQKPLEYGPGMNLELATKAVNAAIAEAQKNGWNLAIAVTTNGGHLVHFSRMDQTQFGSIAIAQHKARAASKFKRPTKAFADAVAAAPGNVALLTLDDIIASEGGIPLVVGGKMVGAIGCSGATGAQDGIACTAGANAVK